MAYTPGQKLEDERDPSKEQGGQAPGAPSAPTISAPSVGSTPAVGGTAVGSSPVGQSNAPAGGSAGTGFVNIDKYLGANQGASKQVKTAADNALWTDSTAFGHVANDVKANTDAQKTPIVDPSKLVNNVLNNGGQPAIDAAKAALAGKFKGPTSVGYDVGNTSGIKKAKAYGNAQSAGTQIATDNGTVGQYGTGLSAIDAAIYGSQGEAPTLQGINESTKGQVEGQIKEKGVIDADAGATADTIAKNAASTRAAFTEKAGSLQDDAKRIADKANADEAAAQIARPADQQTAAGVLAEPTDNDYLHEGQSEIIKLSPLEEQQIRVIATSGGYSPQQYQEMRQKTSDEKWGMRIGQATEVTSRPGLDWASDLSSDVKRKIGELQAKYPGLTREALVRLAKRPDPAVATSKTAQWKAGAAPANAASFLDSKSLNNIGAVLGDSELQNMKRGPEYAGPGKWEY